MTNNHWIANIDGTKGLSLVHIQPFSNPWDNLSTVALVDDVEDSIIWKFTKDGMYSTSSAYKAQFEGLTFSDLVRPCGRYGLPHGAIFLLGLFFKIGFELTTD